MSLLFESLNEAQINAVSCKEGPSLVIAGAGAGKTRVLTYRIAYLLEQGVPPSSILALTFTNKAAREMKGRIGTLISESAANYIWMGTFHSIFSRILRKNAEKLGFPSSFTIYDTDDSKSLMRSIIKELKLDEKEYKIGSVIRRISSAKNKLITAQVYYNSETIREADMVANMPMVGDIYKLYAARCRKAGAMDFDDLLLYTNILFRDFPDILKIYQEKFKYILVDEYQDTNYSQYLIVKKLADTHNNICVVGDDAQSIYSFRGAQIENILNFKKDYPSYQLFKLEQNYRSTQNIVNVANSLIAKNRNQIPKVVFSNNDMGDIIKVTKVMTDIEEGYLVANSIMELTQSQGEKYNQFAILYRNNSQSRIFEEALRRRKIPYKIYGSISFYQRKEIRDIIAYLRLLINSKDDEALKRIINYPTRGIGKTTLGRLEATANKYEISIFEVIIEVIDNTEAFNKGTLRKLKSFIEMIKKHQVLAKEKNAYDVTKSIAEESGIIKDLEKGDAPEEISRFENMVELFNGIKDFVDSSLEEGQDPTLNRFLENVALLTDADTDKELNPAWVSLMTIHAAKGLEFDNVYIPGVEETIMPSHMTNDLEEERRLFYVALTRARKRVSISYAKSRYKWGTPTDCAPSRFVKEMDRECIDWNEPQIQNKSLHNHIDLPLNKKIAEITQNRKTVQSQTIISQAAKQTNTADFVPSDPKTIQVGMRVKHLRFGEGKVMNIEGQFPNIKAMVFFPSMQEEKRLLLKFAKLSIINEQ